jgi:pimeloyl-ACP methyl ester carboxylesterase
METDSGVAEVNGAHLAYDLTGNGPVLVLIHAGIADRRMWEDQISVFGRNYRVLRYDLRGYGESDIPSAPFAHHDDLAGLMRHLGIDQAHILGVSQGGQVAIAFALTYPAMVISLIRVSSGVGEQEPSDVLQRAWEEMERAEETEGLGKVLELELQLWVDGPDRTPQAVDPAVRERVREMNAALFERIPEHEAAEEKPLHPPAIDRFAEIQTPTLIIAGDQDVPDVHAIAELMEASIPNSRKVMIPDAAHMVSMERPDEFNRAVLEFLESLSTD